MRKFTKTEIDLCKKIAEKERREIEVGDTYLLEGKPILCAYSNGGWHKRMEKDIIPLWQEHDCLEWLREKRYRIEFYWNDYGIRIELHHDERNSVFSDRKKQTPLEALLRAVLAVME